MSNSIVKRMEDLLYTPKPEEENASNRHFKSIATCARQHRLREVLKTELSTEKEQTNTVHKPEVPTSDNNKVSSIKDLIAARIAQTEGTETPADRPSKDDRNRTILNLDSLAASIYFWSPNLNKEPRKSRLIQDKFRAPKYTALHSDAENNLAHRNKDAFINFSQPALIVVAENSETPSSTLKWLAAHDSSAVRKAVARNRNTEDETLYLLAEDFDKSVQSAVLDNINISKELTVKLAASANFAIASKARNVYYQLAMRSQNSNATPNKSGNSVSHSSMEVAKNELDFLKMIADSADTSRRLLVKSPHLTADWHIRMLVAGDPNATAEILWQLANHPISQVKRKLVDKYNCLLETMVNLKGSKNSGSDTLAASAIDTIL